VDPVLFRASNSQNRADRPCPSAPGGSQHSLSQAAMSPATWLAVETMKLTDGSYLFPDRPSGSGLGSGGEHRRRWSTARLRTLRSPPDLTSNSIGVATRGPLTRSGTIFKDTTNGTIIHVEARSRRSSHALRRSRWQHCWLHKTDAAPKGGPGPHPTAAGSASQANPRS